MQATAPVAPASLMRISGDCHASSGQVGIFKEYLAACLVLASGNLLVIAGTGLAQATERDMGVGFPYNLYPPNAYGPPRPRSDNIMREGALRSGVPNPEILYPRGPKIPGRPGFVMTSDVRKNDPTPPVGAAPTLGNPATRANQIPGLITACWKPPVAKVGDTMQITVRVSFSVIGEPIGAPVITYVSATDPQAREKLRVSLIEALKRCTPLPISASLGKAIAGRPFAIRFLVGDTI